MKNPPKILSKAFWLPMILPVAGLLFFRMEDRSLNARSSPQNKIDSLYTAIREAEGVGLLKGYLLLGRNYLLLEKYDSTEKYLNAATPLLHLSAKENAEWHRLKATQYMLLGKWDTARSWYHQSLALYRKSGQSVENMEAVIFCDLGKIYIQINLLDSAFHYYNAALATMRKVPQYQVDSHLISLIYNNIGALYFYENQLDSAQEYYDKSRTIAIMQQGDSAFFVGRTLYNIGLVRETKGYYTDAIYFYEKALEIYKKHLGEEHPLLAEAYGGLGSSYLSRNEVERAIYYFEKDQEIIRKTRGETHPEMAWGYENVGRAFLIKNQPHQAIPYLEKALKLRKAAYGDVHSEIADNLIYLSAAYEHDPEKSIQYAREGLNVEWRVTGSPTFRKAEALLQLARLYNANGSLREAMSSADSALKICSLLVPDGRHPVMARARLLKSDIFLKDNHLEMAYWWADKAVDATTERYFSRNEGQPADAGQLLFELEYLQCLLQKTNILNRYYEQTDDVLYLEKILSVCQSAMPVINRLQYLMTSEDAQPLTDTLFVKIYTVAMKAGAALYQARKEDKYLNEIFFFAEQIKNGSLSAAVRAMDLMGVADVPEASLRREYQLKKDIRYYRSILENKELRPEEEIKARERLSQLFAEQEKFYNNMRKYHPAYMKWRYTPEPLSITDLQEKILHPGELMVHITRVEDSLYTLMVAKSEVSLVKKSLQMGRPESLFEAIDRFGKIRQIIWIPDPCISGLLPEAMKTGNKWAIEKYAFIYNSSASLYARKPEKKKNDNQQILAFAPVRFDKWGLPDLVYSEREIQLISSTYKKVTVYMKEDATVSNFLKEMQTYPILHLATHAEMDPEMPLKSRLYFFSDTSGKEVIYAHQLFGQPMRAKLVVLSACRTAEETGLLEGAAGIAAAFAYNGCRNILMNTQQQDDQAAMKIMSAFYGNMAKGMNKSIALQQAKLAYLRDSGRYRTDPKYWAGIILTGDYENFHLQTSPISQKWWIPALLALMAALLYSSKDWVRLRV